MAKKSMLKVIFLIKLTVFNSRARLRCILVPFTLRKTAQAHHIAAATLTYVCRCRLEGGYTSVRRKSSWDEGASEGWTRRAEEGEEGL